MWRVIPRSSDPKCNLKKKIAFPQAKLIFFSSKMKSENLFLPSKLQNLAFTCGSVRKINCCKFSNKMSSRNIKKAFFSPSAITVLWIWQKFPLTSAPTLYFSLLIALFHLPPQKEKTWQKLGVWFLLSEGWAGRGVINA